MNSDDERNGLVFRVIEKDLKDGRQFVFFNKRREGCKQIAGWLEGSGYKGGLLLGKQEKGDAENFDRTKRGLETGDLQFGVGTYQAMGTGIDIPALDVGVLMHPIANDKKGQPFFRQVRGRMCRKSGEHDESWLYYVWDHSIYGKTPLRNLANWCRRVVVYEGGEWIPAREVIARKGKYQCEENNLESR
jgi:hypothetical protein